jgi:hypothetical protein
MTGLSANLLAYETVHLLVPLDQVEKLQRENARLSALVNIPELHDFAKAVVLEATHQRERWGSDHGSGKEPQDWFWVLGYLGGKALRAHSDGGNGKALHHTITVAALAAN